MSHRDTAIALVKALCADAAFTRALADLIAFRTVAGPPDAPMQAYLAHLAEGLREMGYSTQGYTAERHPFLLASRVEDSALPTTLGYAHGDTAAVRRGAFAGGRDAWRLTRDNLTGHWYGRGIAANKGQMLINLIALQAVIAVRGCLGFNHHIVIEMGGETGSPGLRKVCERLRPDLHADLLIASAGTRIAIDTPTVFLGARAPVAAAAAIPAGALSTSATRGLAQALDATGTRGGQAVARLDAPDTMAPPPATAGGARAQPAGTIAQARGPATGQTPRFRALATAADHPAVRFVVASLARTDGQAPAVLPAPGGAPPNGIIADVFGLPMVWIPHAGPGSGPEGSGEHMPQALVAEAAGLMAGLYWDLGTVSKASLSGA